MGPDDTRVNWRNADADPGAIGGWSTINGALSERDREARLLPPAVGGGERSGEGVFTRTNSPCELVKYGKSASSIPESSERDGDGCVEGGRRRSY